MNFEFIPLALKLEIELEIDARLCIETDILFFFLKLIINTLYKEHRRVVIVVCVYCWLCSLNKTSRGL